MGAVVCAHWAIPFLRQMRGPEMLPRCLKIHQPSSSNSESCWREKLLQAADYQGDMCSCGLSQLIRCFLAAEWGRWNLLFNRWHATLWCQSAFCPVGTCPRGSMPWHISVCLTCTCFQQGRIQICCCFCSKPMVLSPADYFHPIADYVSCCFGVFFHKIRVSGFFSITFMLCACCQHFWLLRKPALLMLISNREKTSLPLQASVVTTDRKKIYILIIWFGGIWNSPWVDEKFSGLLRSEQRLL